jgi:hypothetical protein
VAAVLTTVISNPFWRIQTQMSVMGKNATFFQLVKSIISKEGFMSLWKGTSMGMVL